MQLNTSYCSYETRLKNLDNFTDTLTLVLFNKQF